MQLALNDATGAAFVPVGGGGEVGGGVTVPPDPFTRRSRFTDPPNRLDSAPLVAFPTTADATAAGVAPGLLWR